MLTKSDSVQINGVDKVCEQRPLQAKHVPAQDLITAAHCPQALAMLNAIPGGYNVAGLHWDRTLTWQRKIKWQKSSKKS